MEGCTPLPGYPATLFGQIGVALPPSVIGLSRRDGQLHIMAQALNQTPY